MRDLCNVTLIVMQFMYVVYIMFVEKMLYKIPRGLYVTVDFPMSEYVCIFMH